jgi:predicted O-methyltransferase YrrM
MPQPQWSAVDKYLCDLVVPPDATLDACLQTSAAAGLPAINVAPNQGKLLHLLARMHGAKKILEIGTLGGYSTIWLARALPKDGRLITLEFEPKHAAVATKNIAVAGLADRVDVRVGPAIQTLPTLTGEAPFDFVFIDADKVSTAEYFQWALSLTRVGSAIIVDNVVRDGASIQSNSTDEGVQGVRRFNDLLTRENRVSATAIQTVGSKGYDGFCLALVVGV